MTPPVTDRPTDAFLIDPRHEPFVRGTSTSLGDTSLSWFKRLATAALVVVNLVLARGTLVERGPQRYTVDAQVIDREEGGDPFTPVYVIKYTYIDHEGNQRALDRRVDFARYQRTEVGSIIQATYQAGLGHRAEPVEPAAAFEGIGFALLSLLALMLLILWTLYFWIVRPAAINRRLANEGQFITGEPRRADLRQRTTPSPGQPVIVRYVNDSLYRFM
ncbi:MAG: hypothetical protein ACOCXZ_03675 [Chloroflexota bacterium]